MATFRGITYTERVKGEISPREAWSFGECKTVRVFDIAYQDRWQFTLKWLGSPTLKTDSGTGRPYLSRTTPHTYAASDGSSEAVIYATKVVDILPVGIPDAADPTIPYSTHNMKGPDGNPLYKLARCTVQYEALPYDIKEDAEVSNDETTLQRYVTTLYKPYSEFNVLPNGSASFVDSPPRKVPFNIPKIECKARIQITWRQVPILPVVASQFLGSINFFAMDISLAGDANTPVITAAPGTLLYTAVEPIPLNRGITGEQLYDIVYTFIQYEPIPGAGHGWFLDPLDLTYRLVTKDGTASGKPIFPSDDLSKLFIPQ